MAGDFFLTAVDGRAGALPPGVCTIVSAAALRGVGRLLSGIGDSGTLMRGRFSMPVFTSRIIWVRTGLSSESTRASRAFTNSVRSGKRSSGFFSSMRMIVSARFFGRSARFTVIGVGASIRCPFITVMIDSPSNGVWPVSIS